jgi:hypothetical protein
MQRRMSGVGAPLNLGSLAWSTIEAHVVQAGLRNQLEMLTDLLTEQNTGILITLEEIHHNQIEALRELATVVQHTFRENRELAFAAAGLVASVSDVINDDVLTFLRRAERHTLGSVAHADVERALRESIQAAGRDVGEQALQIMVDGARGYPFLLQLVGTQVWRVNPTAPEITAADATRGVARARRRLGALIHEPALSAASDIDKSFLLAMAQDDGPSRMADIQQRLGADVNYASQYRPRLIAAELIHPTRHGYVDFALPYLPCPSCNACRGQEQRARSMTPTLRRGRRRCPVAIRRRSQSLHQSPEALAGTRSAPPDRSPRSNAAAARFLDMAPPKTVRFAGTSRYHEP